MNDPSRPTRVRRPTLAAPSIGEVEQHEHHLDDDAAERAAIEAEAKEAAAAQATVRAEAPPLGAVRQEIRREGHAVPSGPGFVPRDGDVLVISYPEVTLPLPKQYSMMKFGGLIYTRQLRAGDDVDGTFQTIASWLSRVAEADGVAKYRRMVAEFLRKGAGS